MELMGIPYQVVTEDVKEITSETDPIEMVQAIAALKANAVANKLRKEKPDRKEVLIISADTMVFYKNQALGKPVNEEDARRMLQMLSGEVHEVYTGVSIVIINPEGKKEKLSFAVCTKVYVQPLSKEQIDSYIATGEPMDKAGAYAIQGKFGIYIREIIGDYYNVVGFPIAKIYDVLLQKGIDLKKLK
jgi:MAF protein